MMTAHCQNISETLVPVQYPAAEFSKILALEFHWEELLLSLKGRTFTCSTCNLSSFISLVILTVPTFPPVIVKTSLSSST